jgi:Domain of unknown function (DUF4328)
MSEPQPPAAPQPEPPYGAPAFPPPPPSPAYGAGGYAPPAAPGEHHGAQPAAPAYPAAPTYPASQPTSPASQPTSPGAPGTPSGMQAPYSVAPTYPGAPTYSTAPTYPAAQPGYPGAPAMQPGVWMSAPTALRPLRGIGTATRILIAVYAALSLVTVLIDGWGIMTLDAYNSGSVGAEALNAYDRVSVALSLFSVGVLLAAGICWVVWQYRAAASVPRSGLRRSPGWHVGSWFIPVVSLFFPFQNVSDLARSSRAELSGGVRGTWWTLWLASNLVSSFATQAASSARSIPGLTGALAGSMLGELLVIAAAVFAWIIVARITDAIDPKRR